MNKLKTEFINNINVSVCKYDEVLDTLFIYFTPQETERIVTHFIDNNTGLMYRSSDKEIVGIRIENIFMTESKK